MGHIEYQRLVLPSQPSGIIPVAPRRHRAGLEDGLRGIRIYAGPLG